MQFTLLVGNETYVKRFIWERNRKIKKTIEGSRMHGREEVRTVVEGRRKKSRGRKKRRRKMEKFGSI